MSDPRLVNTTASSLMAVPSAHLRTIVRLAGQAKPGSAAGFGEMLGRAVATAAPRGDVKLPAAAGPTVGARPVAQVTVSSDATTTEADGPALPAWPSWVRVAAGGKIVPQTPGAKPGATQAAVAGSTDAGPSSGGDAAVHEGQDGNAPSPAPAIPDIGMTGPTQPDQAIPQQVTSPNAATAPSNADDLISLKPDPASPGDVTLETPVTQQAVGLPVAASASVSAGLAVQTSTATSGSAVPGTKPGASSVAFWSPLKVLSNPLPPEPVAVAPVAGSNGGAGPAPEAAHPAPTSAVPSSAAVGHTTDAAAVLQTEEPAVGNSLGPATQAGPAGSLGLPFIDSGAAAAVASALTQAEPAPSVGADVTTNLPVEPREHGHVNAVAALQIESTATGIGESPAPGVQPSASSAPTSSGRDTAAPSITDQVAPALTAMAQGRIIGRALSVSITPDSLGSVSITVNRAADGTSVIQLGAERMSTLEMLHASQAELGQVLDQAGGHGNHALTFSWNGADSGSSWAGAQGGQREQQGEQRPALFTSSPAEDALTRSQDIVADTDRVDVTA